MPEDRPNANLDTLHALRLEEAARLVLQDPNLSAEDREVLEKAVRIARTILKGMRAAG
jgi:hypothetical protein